MRIGLIRHGLTDWNAAGRIQGKSDIPLNDEGRAQASKLAHRLVDEPFTWDFAISSGLLRAQETAEIIASKLQIPLLEADIRLSERGFGPMEGMQISDLIAQYGDDWKIQDNGQESLQAVEERTLAFIADLEVKYPQQNILIVTHGGLLAQLYTALYKDRPVEKIGNLSLSVLEKRGELWESLIYNCSKHLIVEDTHQTSR
ncbi:histidine phosphatase family protein [Saccharibacillus sp. JS10]|uniref:histidine phosphatase family protein n=1 Tax=Saccharibacillus sp. JS10 TaxID=2950552 RepID=UPI002109650F|nr:histidine phosphatase family protein [Saccharibacillus sp. JS10]MCQ4085780.1 histidine phosphatase family protein [Saccharibacillus sp. JS10]